MRLLASVQLAIATLMLTGCISGGGLSFFPDRFPLGEKAIAQRECQNIDYPREHYKAWLTTYILEPGDGLLILPVDIDSNVRISADHTIGPDGKIDLGKYNMVVAAGKTVHQLEEEIRAIVKTAYQKEKGKENEDPGFIDVRVVNRLGAVYYVQGEVTTPGKYTLNGNETVLDGLINAGGLTDRSSWRDIILVRPAGDGPGQVMQIDYGEIVRLGAGASNYQLRPGDRIYVGSRSMLDSFFNFDRWR
ncbi:MAG: SLBB domain-containing protein [Zavarzinella sp.]